MDGISEMNFPQWLGGDLNSRPWGYEHLEAPVTAKGVRALYLYLYL